MRAVPIQSLVLIPELNPRTRLNEDTIIRYMESFSALPPIKVQKTSLTVVDGFHRVEAGVRLGLEQIEVEELEIPDEELRLVAGLSNVAHGEPLTRAERNRLAVALVTTYGRLREEAAKLLGVGPAAVTLALREHQFNQQLSEKLGTPVQVINSQHVRALYRVAPELREQLLEAVVGKVDEDGRPYPLTGAELKLLVDRMLDPASPAAEVNRLLRDPRARPKPPAPREQPSVPGTPPPDLPDERPWEREWESPLKSGDGNEFDRVRGVDEELADRWGAGTDEERRVRDPGGDLFPPAGRVPGDRAPVTSEEARLRDGVVAAARALERVLPRVEPPEVRAEVAAVLALLTELGR